MNRDQTEGKGIFYGWWIVFVAFICEFIGAGIAIYTFGVFLKPLAKEFGWPRGQVSLGISLQNLAQALTGPFYGKIVDRLGPKKVMLSAIFLMGLILILFLSLTNLLWHFLMLYFLLGLVGGAVISVPIATMVSQWFRKKRGLALGLTMVGASMGGFFFPPLTNYLVAAVGIRQSYALFGLLLWLVLIPIVSLLVKKGPEVLGVLPDGLPLSEVPKGEVPKEEWSPLEGLTFKESQRTPTFWLLSLSLFFTSIAMAGFINHLVPFLIDIGYRPAKASFLMSLAALASVLGRVTSGYLADKLGGRKVTMLFFLSLDLSMVLFLLRPSPSILYLAILFYGVALGAEIDLAAYLTGECFGFRSFGEIYGYIFMAFVIGSVIGTPFMGYIFDAKGSYNLALFISIILTSIAVIAISQVRAFQKS